MKENFWRFPLDFTNTREFNLASRLWALAQFESVCLCFAPARNPANISDAFEDLMPCLFIETASWERFWSIGEFSQSLAGFLFQIHV